MQIQSESRIAHPLEMVFPVYRDRLPEVVPYIPDISAIRVLAREEGGGLVRLHNEWVSDREVPSVVSKFIKPEHLCWDDHATWNNAETACDWVLKTRAFTEAVSCTGRTALVAEGDHTLVRLTGEFALDVAKIRGVPAFLARRLAPQLEKFIVSLVTPNLERVNESLEAFLDEQG
jgi:S-adenosylmethionine:diacylglycerol 3-amino-3-carboxypropyl transferase